ncbi:MAG: cupin domain-containing protein [Candidatus Thermoplasmatota archaeon]|nr:cupin domain-containing protein [Candidatus Thermoplasmatota archaeon]
MYPKDSKRRGKGGVCVNDAEHLNFNDVEEVDARPGIFRKTITMGSIQVVQYRYLPGSVFEAHSHPEEQMTIALEGGLEFDVGGKPFDLTKGDVVHVPPEVPHGAVNRTAEEALTLNIYHPARRKAP